jgi:hypothetical protein
MAKAVAVKIKGELIARLPPAFIGPLASGLWCVRSLWSADVRWSGIERLSVGREVLHLEHLNARRVLSGKVREHLIDQRLHFGRQRRFNEAFPDLQQVARSLAQIITQLKQEVPDRPVIVSPFHFVSQYANIYVVDDLRAKLGLTKLGVVSGMPRDMYGSDNAMIPNIDVLYTYGQANRSGLGLMVARSLRRNGVVVLFADVPPWTLSLYPMETTGVSIFGRPSRIHNGVFRMGASLDALLLPFYLRFKGGRFTAHIFDAIELARPDAPQAVANCIEVALKDNYEHSLVTSHPSMYAFSPAR